MRFNFEAVGLILALVLSILLVALLLRRRSARLHQQVRSRRQLNDARAGRRSSAWPARREDCGLARPRALLA